MAYDTTRTSLATHSFVRSLTTMTSLVSDGVNTCLQYCVLCDGTLLLQLELTHAHVTYKRADAPVMGHLWEYAIVGGDAMADA